MKAYVKHIIGGAALGLALLATTGPTWAGFVEDDSGVSLSHDISYVGAEGSLQGARYSSDNSQHIGCAVVEATAYSYVRCTAQDSNGAWLTCKTADPQSIAQTHSMTKSNHRRLAQRRTR